MSTTGTEYYPKEILPLFMFEDQVVGATTRYFSSLLECFGLSTVHCDTVYKNGFWSVLNGMVLLTVRQQPNLTQSK